MKNNRRSTKTRELMYDFRIISEVCRDKCKEYFKARLQLEWFVNNNPEWNNNLNRIYQLTDKIFGDFDNYIEELKDEEEK